MCVPRLEVRGITHRLRSAAQRPATREDDGDFPRPILPGRSLRPRDSPLLSEVPVEFHLRTLRPSWLLPSHRRDHNGPKWRARFHFPHRVFG
jgi:hypothetical protein